MTDAEPTFSLIALALKAPHIGLRKRWPNVLHAVELDGLPVKTWPDGQATSVCGVSGLRILAASDGPAPWPPYVKGLGEKNRCPECFAQCKKKRPVTRFHPAGADRRRA